MTACVEAVDAIAFCVDAVKMFSRPVDTRWFYFRKHSIKSIRMEPNPELKSAQAIPVATQSLPEKCKGLFKMMRTWRGVLLLLLVSKGTHHAVVTMSKRKSKKCEASKTKKNLSLSALVFIGVAFLLSLVPKGMQAVKKHENIYLTATGIIGILLWIVGAFFD